MSFTKLEQCLANVKVWKDDLKTSALETPDEVRNEFMHNVIPILESLIKANTHEFGDVFDALDGMDAAIVEIVGREGDFLQPEMAENLTATLILGMFIVDTIGAEGIKLEDELQNKRLQDATKLYRQNTAILLEQIKEVTVDEDEDDDEEEDSDDDTNDGDAPIIHGQSEDTGIDDGRGEGTPSGDAGTNGDGNPIPTGTDTTTGTTTGARDNGGA